MIYTNPIEFTSIDDIIDNFTYYKEIFLRDGLLLFRNANLSLEEQELVHNGLEKKFGCIQYINKYIENHGNHGKVPQEPGPDGIMLEWHVEHPYYIVPIGFSTWRMYNFKTDPENGKTYFVDMEHLFNMLPKDHQEFLKLCSESNALEARGNITNYHDTIGYHWINGNPVIRTACVVYPNADLKLRYFDGRPPTEQEIAEHKNILDFVRKQIYENLDIRIVHKWNEGDLLVPDMYKLCHAVTGGFDPKDREFSGMWGYYNIDNVTELNGFNLDLIQ